MLGWDDSTYVIRKADKTRAIGTHQDLILMHDPKRELDAELCNVSRVDGTVCRMMAGHEGDHIPFGGEVICAVGIYVAAVVDKTSRLP